MIETVVLARAAKDLTIPVLGAVTVTAVGMASYTIYQYLKDSPFTLIGDIWDAVTNPVDTTVEAGGSFFSWVGTGWSKIVGEWNVGTGGGIKGL